MFVCVNMHTCANCGHVFAAGHLTKENNVSWRGDSGMQDDLSDSSTPHVNLVGGYYDAGDHIKFSFPEAFSMTMLSWSVIDFHDYA